MNKNTEQAVISVKNGEIAMSKFITPNDVGATGGHQSGFHIHKNTSRVFFETEGKKGENKDHFIKIKWQNDFETDSRAIYYGVGTRNEYRLTRFGRNFPFLNEDNIGDLLILVKMDGSDYEGYVLRTDDEMEDFFDTFGMSPMDTNAVIETDGLKDIQQDLNALLTEKALAFKEFPTTVVVADLAREIFKTTYGVKEAYIKANPDKIILDWVSIEYDFFKALENQLCSEILNAKFEDTESFVKAANSIANRRKSRAGKSLELHLEELFKIREVRYETQVYTEARKQPDFIFPGSKEYHDMTFPSEGLISLASKTTCKDRWRQVLNEADRIETKHLFTLQQGISSNQLSEMYEHGIHLVVPQAYIGTFPQEFRDRISPLNSFINFVETTQR